MYEGYLKFLERYLDPLEVLTCDDYLGLARCLLLVYRGQRENVGAYAGMLMVFVVGVIRNKLGDDVRSQRIREYHNADVYLLSINGVLIVLVLGCRFHCYNCVLMFKN